MATWLNGYMVKWPNAHQPVLSEVEGPIVPARTSN